MPNIIDAVFYAARKLGKRKENTAPHWQINDEYFRTLGYKNLLATFKNHDGSSVLSAFWLVIASQEISVIVKYFHICGVFLLCP